jgi:vesicle coat complex subunit
MKLDSENCLRKTVSSQFQKSKTTRKKTEMDVALLVLNSLSFSDEISLKTQPGLSLCSSGEGNEAMLKSGGV